ncbi:hypothetical protein ACQYJ8_001127, partial [Escherichia coli]
VHVRTYWQFLYFLLNPDLRFPSLLSPFEHSLFRLHHFLEGGDIKIRSFLCPSVGLRFLH